MLKEEAWKNHFQALCCHLIRCKQLVIFNSPYTLDLIAISNIQGMLEWYKKDVISARYLRTGESIQGIEI